MIQILAALGRITGAMQGISSTLQGVAGTLNEIVKLGVYGLGGVTLKLSEKIFAGIENTPFFKKFEANFGSKYMTPFGTTLYWNEIQQQIRQANRQLGIAGQLGQTIEKNIIKAGTAALEFGFSEKEIVETYKNFIEEYQRNEIFSEDDLLRISKVSYAFGESFNKLFAINRLYGGSIETTYEFLEDLNKTVDRFGLNSKKVFSDIQSNIRLIDKYNFKNGQQGLANMVIQANKLGMQMEEVVGFAEKVYNPEDAIDAAAGLQMLGGQFAMLGDPFQLLYESNNDLEAFTKKLSQVTKGMATLNKTSGQFDLSSLNLRQLREFSKITGQSLENLSQQAKLFAKEDLISKILPKDLSNYGNIDEFISKIGSMSTYLGGTPKIKIDGVEKLVSELSKTDFDKISQISVTPEGDSFDGLVKSNQTLGDQIAIFSNQFTRAINKFEFIGYEIDILNNILSKGSQSLMSGNLNNIANVINEAKKGSAQSFERVMLPTLENNFSLALGNAWENMDFKSTTNQGTSKALIDMMGGEGSMGGQIFGTFIDIESAIHKGFTEFGGYVGTFGKWVGKLTGIFGDDENTTYNLSYKSATPDQSGIPASQRKVGIIGQSLVPAGYKTSFTDTDKALDLFTKNYEARIKMERELSTISKSEVLIKGANATQKIEFTYNGKVFDVYDLFESEKFRQMLRKDMGDAQANALLSHYTNGGRNTMPTDTMPR